MKKIRKICALTLSLIMLLSTSIHTLAATSELQRVDYFETEDYTLWGEEDENGILYVIMLYRSGDMYVAKTDMNADNIEIYGAMFAADDIKSEVAFSKSDQVYWSNLKSYAKNSADKFTLVTDVALLEDTSRATTAENATINKMKAEVGAPYTNLLKKTDTTSYPGTTIRVFETKSLGAKQSSNVLFKVGATIADVVATLANIFNNTKVEKIANIVKLTCQAALAATGVFTKGGTIVSVFGSVVYTRYCTVNGGSVTYSSATKKMVYDATYYKEGNTVSCFKDYTQFSPSEYSYGDSNNYLWLINTAYNNYN